MRHRVRRQEGDYSARPSNCFGNKKTNNALGDKTCPDVDMARCFGKELEVDQGFSGRQAEVGWTRARMLVQLPAQGKCQQGSKTKTKEVMLKKVPPGKV